MTTPPPSTPTVLFIVAVAALTLALLVHLLFSAQIVGLLLTLALRRLGGKEQSLSIGAVSFAPLAGRVFLKDVHYLSADVHLRVVDGYLTFRWFLLQAKGDASRVVLHLNGLELTVYGNSAKYDQLVELDRQRNAEEPQAQSLAPVSPGPSAAAVIDASPPPPSRFQAAMDVLRGVTVAVHRGRVFIGSPARPYVLLAAFSGATGVLKLVDAPVVEDLYRSLVELQFDGLTVEWVHNPRHVATAPADGGETIAGRRAWSFRIRPVEAVMGGFEALAKELRYNIGRGEDNWDQTVEESAVPPESTPLRGAAEGPMPAEHDKVAQALAAAYGRIVTNAQARVLYYCDQVLNRRP